MTSPPMVPIAIIFNTGLFNRSMTTGTQIPQIDENRYIPKHRTILGEISVEDEALGQIGIEVQVEHYDETLDRLIEEKRRM